MRFAIFPLHLSKVLRLPRKSDVMSYEVLHLSRRIISANLKLWCSKMQPLSGNQRPDLPTSLINMSLVLRLPREIHLFRSSSNVPLAPATQNDASTTKSGANMWCLVHFDLKMCFAPQQRTLFEHLNFQKCSEAEVFCTFWLGNVLRCALYILPSKYVLRTTRACTFSSLIWPAGFAPAALASLLFDPPEPHIIGKTQCFRDFPTFSRTWIFFVLRLSLLWSSFFFPSLLWLFPSLLFICPHWRKFDFYTSFDDYICMYIIHINLTFIYINNVYHIYIYIYTWKNHYLLCIYIFTYTYHIYTHIKYIHTIS